MSQLFDWWFAQNTTAPTGHSGPCCLALLSSLGSKVSLPGSVTYSSSLGSYYSLDSSETTPLCIVSPETAEDVSATIKTLTITATDLGYPDKACQFAVRSGGHMGFGSSIDGGVTIDLRALNTVSVNDDRSLASIGVGATWDVVYAQLDPLGLSVNGGRAANVGVGGLTLGGGISYSSPRYGFTCDSVSNFQIVLANGSIVDAKTDPDLLVALRGGTNNFGVVTRVDLDTFEQGQIWGGMIYHPASTLKDQIDAFIQLNSVDAYDEHASQILIFAYSTIIGILPVNLIINEIEYTRPEANPPVFEPVMNLPRYYSTMRLTKIADLSLEGGGAQPKGLCQTSAVLTFESTAYMLNATHGLWQESLSEIKGVSGITWSLSLEPLPPAIYAKGASANSLGLGKRTKPLVVMLLTASFKRVADKQKVEAASQKFISAVKDEAQEQNAYDPWVYLNYAAPWQDPISSYGEESLKRLREVRKRVDPHGVFTHTVPRGFKINDHDDQRRHGSEL
ncbi:putative oxidoreductase [Hypomontagnella submonticulosa]|nr:putative oxidoreductase [Hypomontagnella submonticulosa]